MAMTAAGLAAAITAAQGVAPDSAIQNAANLALATGIVTYLKTNAEVNPGIPVLPVGVTSAPGSLN
jgi:hypothetical protein